MELYLRWSTLQQQLMLGSRGPIPKRSTLNVEVLLDPPMSCLMKKTFSEIKYILFF